MPPFYNEEFFLKIREAHTKSPLNIFKMSERDWYTWLLEDNWSMQEEEEEVGDTNHRSEAKCRV